MHPLNLGEARQDDPNEPPWELPGRVTGPRFRRAICYGFTVLEADAKQLKMTFIGTDGGQLYKYTLTKEA